MPIMLLLDILFSFFLFIGLFHDTSENCGTSNRGEMQKFFLSF